MKVYCGGACLDRPRMRISQMAASVESRGMNLMQSRLFRKACSSVEQQTMGDIQEMNLTQQQQQKSLSSKIVIVCCENVIYILLAKLTW